MPPRRPSSPASTPAPEQALTIAGRPVTVETRINPRARRIGLRIDAARDRVVMVVPHRRHMAEARRFLNSRAAWVAHHLNALPPPLDLVSGASLPFLGDTLTICHRPDTRRGVWREGDVLNVSGRAEHLPRRVRDWLRARAREAIESRVAAHGAALDVTPGRITLRDTRSRWGSCSRSGGLSFSWRLVMAPAWVLDYVAAHEVAHLREMNHSPAFWRHVEALVPGGRDPARAWLREFGVTLHRIG